MLQNTFPSSFSALSLLVVSFDPEKTVSDMTYNVFVGSLNLTQLTSTRTLPIYFDFRRMGNKLPDYSRFPKLMVIGVYPFALTDEYT